MQGDLPVMLVVICVQWKILICTARLNSAVPNDVASIKQMQEDFVLGWSERNINILESFECDLRIEAQGKIISDLQFC